MKVLYENITCKFCASPDVVLNGTWRNQQRYLCKTCGRGFQSPHNLPKMQFPMKMIASAIGEYISGTSLHRTANNLERDYGVSVSHDTVYKWIQKYIPISYAKAEECGYKFGDTWIADETVIKAGTKRWLFVCIDAKTRFILATHLSATRNMNDAKNLFKKASKTAKGQIPETVITDGLRSYIDALEQLYGADSSHIVSTPFGGKVSTALVERWHSTLKDRIKPTRGLSRISTAQKWLDAFVHDYNFYRPHMSLGNKTPAQAAKATLPFKDWIDVVQSLSYPTASKTVDYNLDITRKPIASTGSRSKAKTKHPKRKRKLQSGNAESSTSLSRMK